jgi:hypothetical protein
LGGAGRPHRHLPFQVNEAARHAGSADRRDPGQQESQQNCRDEKLFSPN